MREYVRRLPELVSTSLWFLPAGMIAASLAAAVGTTALDVYLNQLPQARRWEFAISGSPDGAREILSTISGSMLTITGVVFSITMLVLQMASSQFSPRTLRTFLRDLPSKLALGTFLGTFVYALLGLRAVRSEGAPGGVFVPGVTVGVSLLLVLMSIAMLVYFIHHVASRIRVTSIIAGIGEETLRLVERSLPERAPDQTPMNHPAVPEALVIVPSVHSGVLVEVDTGQVVHVASEAATCVSMLRTVGEFVPKNAALFGLTSDVDDRVRDALLQSMVVADERTMEQDVAYGLRQLTDIALRALSPALNDPTTAIDVVHAEHDILRRIGSRLDPQAEYRDESGRLRLVLKRPSWEEALLILFDEIGEAGSSFRRVREALQAAAADLVECLPEDRVRDVRRVAGKWLPTGTQEG